MKELRKDSYDRGSVKQRFIDEFGPMLEPHEVNLDNKVKEQLLTMWPGDNIPVYPKFQFNDDGTPNQLFLKVMELICSNNRFYSPKLICNKLFKDENGTRGIDLIRGGKKKQAIEWAKNFDNINLTMF